MDVGKPPRKSIRRPVTVISGADGKPPIEVTPRQIVIGKALGAALGAVPVAVLLLAFNSNMGSASPAPDPVQIVPDRVVEDAARARAEAQDKAEGNAGIFYASCTEMPSEGGSIRRFRQLRYENGEVRESISTTCEGAQTAS